MSDYDYTNERVVGHRVHANLSEDNGYDSIESLIDSDIDPTNREYVYISEGDVDWEDSRQVCLSVTELREMALKFTDLSLGP